MMASQTLFSRAIGYHLPTAIPTKLERIDEFCIGKVLTYRKKPRKFMPWRQHELNFTGYSLTNLLEEGQSLKFTTASNFLFDVQSSKNTIDATMDLDAELKAALLNLNISFETKDQKKYTITADLGKITHIQTDLFPLLAQGTFKVNMKHPIVEKAVENGGTLFVISTVYESERCNINLSSATSSGDHGQVVAEPAGVGGSVGVSYDASNDLAQVTNRNLPTPVAFLLLRLVISSHGELRTKLNTGIRYISSSPGSIEWSLRPSDFTRPATTVLTVPRINPQESLDLSEWVMIDVVKEEKAGATKDGGATVKVTTPEMGMPYATPIQPVIAHTLEPAPTKPVQPTTTALTTLTPATTTTTTTTPSPKPTTTTTTTVVTTTSHPSGTTAAHAAVPAPPTKPVQPAPAEHTDAPAIGDQYEYSLKDFQAFSSNTYRGVLFETRRWMAPIVDNEEMQKAFLEYTKPPHTFQKLKKLSEYLHALGGALRTHKKPPENTNLDFNPILQTLSRQWQTQVDEVTALIMASEACMEFPQHTLPKMFALTPDKRETLIKLIESTPYGTNKHLFTDEGPFNDPVLYPIVNKMGYSLPYDKLLYTSPEDDEEDMLAAGIIVIEIAPV